jgi:hypothetical protein
MRKALVPMTPAHGVASARPASTPRADFVAHLIAGRLQVAQTRARRRAKPADALAAYGAVGQWPTPTGRMLSRAL